MGNDPQRIEITDPETGEVREISTGLLENEILHILMSRSRQHLMATTWNNLTEAQQRELRDSNADFARRIVHMAVEAVSEVGLDYADVTAKGYKEDFEKGVTFNLEGRASDEVLVSLRNAPGHRIRMYVLDHTQFNQGGEPVQIDADQPEMDLDPPEEIDPDDLHRQLDEMEARGEDAPGNRGYKAGFNQTGETCPFRNDDKVKAWEEGVALAQQHLAMIRKDGAEAREAGKKEADNPHEEGRAADVWLEGFRDSPAEADGDEAESDEAE